MRSHALDALLLSALLGGCGRSEGPEANTPNVGGSSQGGSSQGGSSQGGSSQGGSSQGGLPSAGSGGGKAAWFEVLEPLPSPILGPDIDPADIANETVIIDSSADGSVAIGYSWAAVELGVVALGSEAFRFTRAGGLESLGYVNASPPAQAYVTAKSVSRDGSVILGSYAASGVGPYFRWTEETGMLPLDPDDFGGTTMLGDMSDDGAILAATRFEQAQRWSAPTGFVGLGMLPGHDSSSGLRVSPDGRAIVGTSYNAESSTLFRWTEDAGMLSLELPRCFVPKGGVGENGAVVLAQCMNAEDAVEVHAWTEATGSKILGTLAPDALFQAVWASADRKVMLGDVQQSGGGRQGYRVDEASGVVALGTLPGLPTCLLLGKGFIPTGERPPMSRDASVIVGTCINTSSTAGNRGFRWTEATGLVALEPLPGHDEAIVTSVSPDGIVGGLSASDAGKEVVLWNTLGEAASLRAELEAAGVELGGFQLDGDVVVVEGGRMVHGSGHDAAGAGRAWIARRP